MMITDLEHQANLLEEKIDKKNTLDQLEGDGIEFELREGEDKRHLPSIQVRVGLAVYYIKWIKVLSKTKSGKSANIELKVIGLDGEIKTVTYNNVRIEKIEIVVLAHRRMMKKV